MAGVDEWMNGITATTWLDKADEPKAGKAITLAGKGSPKWWPGFGLWVPGVAVPWTSYRKGTLITVRNPETNVTLSLPILDHGPWFTDDPWLPNWQRPRTERYRGQLVYWSEARQGWFPGKPTGKPHTCNGAGLDLTPCAQGILQNINPVLIFERPTTIIVEVRRL